MNKMGLETSLFFKLCTDWSWVAAGICFIGYSAIALENPYASIVERNTFGLKPVVATPVAAAPTTPAPGVLLQGISTILGKPQVLLEVKTTGQSASTATLVLDVGQRDGDVEVVAIDVAAGAVTMKVQGNLSVLNLKDHSAKLAPGPAITASQTKLPAALPLPTPTSTGAIPPPANSAATAVTTFGGTGTEVKPQLPTRSLRSGQGLPMPSSQIPPESNPNDARSLSLDAQRALIEIERERTRAAVEAGKMPPIPTFN